jgi:hypothetical protein
MKKIYLLGLLAILAACENPQKGRSGNTTNVVYDTNISRQPSDTINTRKESYTNGPDNAAPGDSATKKY